MELRSLANKEWTAENPNGTNTNGGTVSHREKKTSTDTMNETSTNTSVSKNKGGKDKGVKEKRAPSAYNIFMSKALNDVKKENPGKKQSELMTLAAQKWRESKGTVA